MCSCALFLRKHGFRDVSCFFDWLTSYFFENIKLIENDFGDVLNSKFFIQEYTDNPHLVTNTKYKFVYTHVFDPKTTYTKQKTKVEKYINKRIANFKKTFSDNSLLVYYCRDLEEQKKIENSTERIIDFINKFNTNIIFIFNNKVEADFPFKTFVIPYNNIHKPIGGEVSYPFEGGDTDELIDWLTERYDESKILKNKKYKKRRNLFVSLINKLKRNKKNVLKF